MKSSVILNSIALAALLVVGSALAADQSAPTSEDGGLRQWKDDFSDLTAFAKNWVPYGRLADGQWAQGAKARPEWWQVVDGALRGQNFPEEKHAAGISRSGQLSPSLAETGVRVSWRVKIDVGSKGTLRLFGKSAGEFSTEATDNHVTALEVSAAGLRLWNGNRLLSGKAPDKTAERYRNTIFEKKAEGGITPSAWHALVMELRKREVKVLLDGKEALSFTLESEQPLRTLSLEADGDKKSTGVVWFDDIAVEPPGRTP